MDGDEPEAVADWLSTQAATHEPEATRLVVAVAAEVGGSIERLDSRFKGRDSIIEKLERFRYSVAPHYRTRRFNDALRYTVVFEHEEYWEKCGRFIAVVRGGGYAIVPARTEWLEEGYKGINCTAQVEGFSFEVQLHTPASLAAAEETHALYEAQRTYERGSFEERSVRKEQYSRWNEVPVPEGFLAVE